MKEEIANIGKLLRVHSLLGGAIPVFGALCVTDTIFEFRVLLLILFGMFNLAFGMGLNDIYDVEFDLRISGKVLLTGALSMVQAKVIVGTVALISFFLGVYLAYPSVIAALILAACFVSGLCYDKYSHRKAYSGIFAALWIFFFVLFGAAVMGATNTLALAISTYFAIFMFECCSIQGAIKDLSTDPNTNFARVLGSLYNDDEERLYLSPQFKFVGFSVKVIELALLLYIFFYLIMPTAIVAVIGLLLMVANIVTFVNYINAEYSDKFLRQNLTLNTVFSFTIAGLLVFQSLYEFFFLLALAVVWLLVWKKIERWDQLQGKGYDF